MMNRSGNRVSIRRVLGFVGLPFPTTAFAVVWAVEKLLNRP